MAHFDNYDYLKTSNACVKCGKCLPDCTIFSINGDEATSPRGFIDLLGAYQRKEIPLDKNAKDIFYICMNIADQVASQSSNVDKKAAYDVKRLKS